MFIAVINHGLTAQALLLKQAFLPHARAIAIDSGSDLTAEERAAFDVALPNVYYTGLINAVAKHTASLPPDEPVFIWCSDVTCPDYGRACALVAEAFNHPRLGVYAPSAHHSGLPQMANRRTARLRRVTYTDGFCFAVRANLLRELCPVDTRINRLGWGLELHLAYLARRAGQHVVIDDRVEVRHPQSCGYNRKAAWRERGAWQASLPPVPRLFHQLARRPVAKNPVVMRLLLALPW